MNTQTKHLERLALLAHKQNMPWATFWETISDQVRQAEPISRERYRKLYNHLLHIALTGDRAGQEPPGDTMPWERADCNAPTVTPDDTVTQARLLWPVGEPGHAI